MRWRLPKVDPLDTPRDQVEHDDAVEQLIAALHPERNRVRETDRSARRSPRPPPGPRHPRSQR